jgi:asparagine synthase (glutamine-hydrolysing)
LTAVAGHVLWPSSPDPADCAAILHSQRAYGSGTIRLKSWHCATFGIQLNPLLPEDEFDTQPLIEADRLMVADVRLDNREELARALGIDAATVRRSSDSTLLLQAWLRWGEDSLDRIVGDFAFAVYSARDKRLTLVRDPIGERPLFYARSGEQLGFASMPAALLALPCFRRGLDFGRLARIAGDIIPPGDASSFNGIMSVLPGQIVALTPDRVQSRLYWQPSLDPFGFRSDDNYVDAFREVLETSVRARLRRRDGPIAAQLSSGWDSSAVSATAARVKASDDELVAYTAAPRQGFEIPPTRHRFPDESALASLTARMNALRHVIIRDYGSGLSHMRELVRMNQDPIYNYVNLGWIAALGQAAKDIGARTYLTGEHGNLSLNAGGLRLLGDLVNHGQWLSWARESWLALHSPTVSWRGVLINSFQAFLPSRMLSELIRKVGGRRPRSSSVFLRPKWIETLARDIDDTTVHLHSSDFRQLRLDLLRMSDMGVGRKGFLAMFGAEQRAPLGDRRVIEFSLRLPSEQLFRNGRSRPLASRALADRLPAEVLDASRRGYQAADWFEKYDLREIEGMTEEIAGVPAAAELVDIPKIRETLSAWPGDNMESNDAYQRLAVDLPQALATGLFVVQAEKWLAGRFD